MKDFEVGKFYWLNLGWTSKYIPALCVRALKRKVEFQYLLKCENGALEKVKTSRLLRKATEHSHAEAYVSDTWSTIRTTTADMESEKPPSWDSVEG